MTSKKQIAVVSLLASLFISGCAQLPQNLDVSSISNKLTDIGKGKWGATKFEQSGLANILKATDDPNGWPRIALAIDDMPFDAGESFGGMGRTTWFPPAGHCVTFSATVWKSEKVSQQFDHIPFCSSDISNGQINNTANVNVWAKLTHNTTQNTGRTRTNGPTPPLVAFPPVRSVIIDPAGPTRGGAMFGALLLALGLDLSMDAIHGTRVWVVSTTR